MKTLNYFNPLHLSVLLFDLFCKNLLDKETVDFETCEKSSFSNLELSDLEILVQWGDLTNALEHDSAYLKALKSIKDEVFLNLGLKPKEDYLTKTVLSHEVMRSLTARYSNPSNYLLN